MFLSRDRIDGAAIGRESRGEGRAHPDAASRLLPPTLAAGVGMTPRARVSSGHMSARRHPTFRASSGGTHPSPGITRARSNLTTEGRGQYRPARAGNMAEFRWDLRQGKPGGFLVIQRDTRLKRIAVTILLSVAGTLCLAPSAEAAMGYYDGTI